MILTIAEKHAKLSSNSFLSFGTPKVTLLYFIEEYEIYFYIIIWMNPIKKYLAIITNRFKKGNWDHNIETQNRWQSPDRKINFCILLKYIFNFL
jgi:hypothetical protein